MKKSMSAKEFQKNLAVYGADLARWPDEQAARAYIAATPAAQEDIVRAAALETALDTFAAPPVPEGLAARASVVSVPKPVAPVLERLWLPFAGGVFAAMAFLMVALQPPAPKPQADTVAFLEQMQVFAAETDAEMEQADELMAFLEDAAPTPSAPDGDGDVDDDDTADQPVWDYFMGSPG